jgi:DNA recombination protein RmuC
MSLSEVVLILLGVLGCFIVWLVFRSSSAALQSRLSLVQQDLTNARAEIAKHVQTNSGLNARIAGLETTLEHERKAGAEKLELLNQATEKLRQTFAALSADALKSNNQAFLELARTSLEKFQSEAEHDLEQRQKAVETLVAPISESLKKVDNQIQKIEESRKEAYGSLKTQVQSLISTQDKLQLETGNLVKALRAPNVRGQWGEIQLKRVVEIAGMIPYCDFAFQETVTTSTGRLRPDLIIRLPGAKSIVVDAKTPLLAYLEAVESSNDDVRRRKLADHANQVRTHIQQLSSKAYWEQFESAP